MEDDEYNKKMNARMEGAVRKMQEEQQRKEIARRILEDDAYQRFMNIKVTNPDLYAQMFNILVSVYQNQGMKGKITEKQLIQIIERITYKPEPTISFKHK